MKLNYYLLTLLIFSILFSCNQDEVINEQNSKIELKYQKITLKELQNKSGLKKPLTKLSKNFDINKTFNKNIKATDSSFTILTEEIVQVTNGNKETYSFFIETPTDITSTFENFVIEVLSDNTYQFMINKYSIINDSTEEFPYNYNVSTQNITQNQININDFDDFLNKSDSGEDWKCYVYSCITTPRDYDDCSWVLVEVQCSGGGMPGTDTSDTNTSDDGIDANHGIDSDEGNDYNGGNNSNTGTASGIIKEPKISKKQVISDCLGIPMPAENGSTDTSFNYNDWLSTASGLEISGVAKFLSNNECSQEAQDFALEIIDSILANPNINTFEEALNNITLFESKDPETSTVLNIQSDLIDCFDTTTNQNGFHSVTIYVDQPIANSTDTYIIENGDVNVGHTFIELEQSSNLNINRKIFGFYPSNSVSPTEPEVTGVFVYDDNHEYDVSLRIELTPNQFNDIISIMDNFNNNPSPYNLNDFNCSDFGLSIINSSGIGINDTFGEWSLAGMVLGGGTNPGNLGQDIRNLDNNLPSNALNIDTNGGNANNSITPCN